MNSRVLMVGPNSLGGASALIRTLVLALEQQADLKYLPTVERRPLKESGKLTVQNMALAISQYARFLCAVLRFRPHIVHLHTSQGLGWLKDSLFIVMGKACRCRVVLHVHAADFGVLYDQSPRLMQWYSRKTMGLADAVIAVSEEWGRRLAHIVPADRVFTFKNCTAVDALPPHFAERSEDVAKALFLGSVGPRKGVLDLLEAMSRLKSSGIPMHLWVAGNEESEGDLLRARARLEELHLEDVCQLLGYVRGERKAQLLSEASLFALPSYQEGLPIAILEAMAAGLAIVATPVGGIPEVVRDGFNGFLVTPGDVDALAGKLTVLANDRPLCEVMGRRSREIVEQELNVKPYVKRLVTLYESLLGAKPDAGFSSP